MMTLFDPVVIFPLVSLSVSLIVSSVLIVIPLLLLIVSLLNVEPVIVCALVPLKVNVLVLALNVPELLQFPFTWWENELALNVVPNPSVKFPFTVSPTTAVADAVPLMVKLPLIVVVAVCSVLVPLPLSIRCPYVWELFRLPTVCEEPLYSTVLVAPMECVL
jgi:hypothetical protein